MTYTSKDIANQLQAYPSLMRIEKQLAFELSVSAGDNSDVALRKGSANQDYQSKLAELLYPVATKLRRMEYYIGLLTEEDGAVLKALYFDGLTYKETASTLLIDEKTIAKRKKRGLSELAAMYSRLPEDR